MKTIEEIMNYESDPEVIAFIECFIGNSTFTDHDKEVIRKTFMNGYCFYFAYMLKIAFGRGQLCWAAPHSHIVWVDDNGCPYDVEGVCATEALHFIPIEYLGDFIEGFMHNRFEDEDEPLIFDDEEMWDVIHKYEDEHELPRSDADTWYLSKASEHSSACPSASEFDGDSMKASDKFIRQHEISFKCDKLSETIIKAIPPEKDLKWIYDGVCMEKKMP